MQHHRTLPWRDDHAFNDPLGNRLFLFAMRRMASAGVNDAHAANALLGHFGKSYRRPLVLMRAMMLEMARVADRKILVAPCCCLRLTSDEAMLLQATSEGLNDPQSAYDRLSTLLSNTAALGALTCVQAVAQSFADLGRPVEFYAAGSSVPASPML
ncbi:MAG: hypothetical protein DI547_06880 [Sphingobium sp.]|jgi:hypothetical protein|nr:MAG: hypothetical protein DI547_06880 [Sphingobium sp.]